MFVYEGNEFKLGQGIAFEMKGLENTIISILIQNMKREFTESNKLKQLKGF